MSQTNDDYRDCFPLLSDQNHEKTSAWNTTYNCIAWAAGTSEQWWEAAPGYYWPEGAGMGEDVANLIEAFETLDYLQCCNGELEEGFEKVALYAQGTAWTHAARQLPNGHWTSKLGQAEDIEHILPELVQGTVYGDVHCFMKRKCIG